MSEPSRERDTLLAADRAGREVAQTRFTGTLLLEAGAGTGKTTTLVARLLAWMLGPGWEVAAAGAAEAAPERTAAVVLDGIVAITFTEAAAAEMARRVAGALTRLASGRPQQVVGFDPALLPPAARQHLAARSQALLAALDRLTVETLHAFCRGLLARHALVAGLHPQIVVDADLAATEALAAEIVEARVREAYGASPRHPLTRLAAAGCGPAELVELLRRLVNEGVPARVLEQSPFTAERCAALMARLREAIDAFMAAGGEALAAATASSTAVAAIRELRRLRAAAEARPAGAAELARWLEEALAPWRDDKLRERLKKWRAPGFNRAEQSAVGERGSAVASTVAPVAALLGNLLALDPSSPASPSPLRGPAGLELARRAVAPLLSEVQAQAAARGTLAFASLLREAVELLARHPEVRAQERRRIRQLLVDEFQDTDPLQCGLVRHLALEGPSAERPGLFLVGDPKQSIFGWRSADLTAYHDLATEALGQGGARHVLVENFRSTEPLLEEVGRAVRPIMIEEERFQPAYQELVAGADLAAERSTVEYWISWLRGEDGEPVPAGRGRSEAVARLEARAVAADLLRAHAAGTAWREMAILLRATTGAEPYLETLRDAGVPFLVTRDRHYYRRREVIEAAALVQAVLDPLDHVSLLAYLRSAWGGLPDAALLPLWRRGFPRLASGLGEGTALEEARALLVEVARELPADVPGLERIAGWEAATADALAALAELREAWRHEPADRFFRRLRRRALIDVTEAARYQGRYRLANLDHLFRRLEAAAEEHGGDLATILRALRRSLDEAPDAPEAQPKDAGQDVVQVLTIHKAKGLEFRRVYLVDTQHQRRGEDSRTPGGEDDRWDPTWPQEYRLLGLPTPGFDQVRERRRRVGALEEVRTLYVALTRAAEALIVVGNWPEPPSPAPIEQARSLLDLLLHRRETPPSLAALVGELRREGLSWVDRGGVRWRFLALEAPEAIGEKEEPGSGSLVDVGRLRAGAAELARQRLLAGERQRLPFARPASAEAAERLAALFADEEAESAYAATVSRDAALLAGIAIHRLFEHWDLDAPWPAEWERGQATVRRWLAARPEAAAREAAVRAEALLRRLAAGTLLQRFAALGSAVVARELAVLLPPDAGAAGCVAGAIDLVYRDEGELVVVDFKTDEVEDEEALAARAAAYAPQEALYARALQEGLGPPAPPRCELWFLWADRVWRTP